MVKKNIPSNNMPALTDNKISNKVYNKLSEYKDLEVEILKVWLLKTNTVPVLVGSLCVRSIEEQINALATFLAVLAYMKCKKLHFAELSTINVTEKYHPKEVTKNINP